jgi:hypothetical protein
MRQWCWNKVVPFSLLYFLFLFSSEKTTWMKLITYSLQLYFVIIIVFVSLQLNWSFFLLFCKKKTTRYSISHSLSQKFDGFTWQQHETNYLRKNEMVKFFIWWFASYTRRTRRYRKKLSYKEKWQFTHSHTLTARNYDFDYMIFKGFCIFFFLGLGKK